MSTPQSQPDGNTLPATAANDSRRKRIENILIDDGRRGVHLDLPDREYHAIERMNPSSLVTGFLDHSIRESHLDPSAVKLAFEGERKPPATASQDRMDRGTLADIMLLTPDRERDLVAVWDGATRKGAAWDGFEDENAGKFIIRRQDYEQVATAVRAVRFNEHVCDLLRDIETHIAIFTKEGNVNCMGQMDLATRGRECRIGDLKTTEAGLDTKSIERTIRSFHYREKMAAYRRWYQREKNVEVLKCFNLFLSLSPPYRIVLVEFTTQAMEWGEMRMMAMLAEVERCTVENDWPIYFRREPADVATWELPDDGTPEVEYD